MVGHFSKTSTISIKGMIIQKNVTEIAVTMEILIIAYLSLIIGWWLQYTKVNESANISMFYYYLLCSPFLTYFCGFFGIVNN